MKTVDKFVLRMISKWGTSSSIFFTILYLNSVHKVFTNSFWMLYTNDQTPEINYTYCSLFKLAYLFSCSLVCSDSAWNFFLVVDWKQVQLAVLAHRNSSNFVTCSRSRKSGDCKCRLIFVYSIFYTWKLELLISFSVIHDLIKPTRVSIHQEVYYLEFRVNEWFAFCNQSNLNGFAMPLNKNSRILQITKSGHVSTCRIW